MKYLFLILILTCSTANAKQIVLDIPDGDIAIVENYVVDAEVWIRDAWKGKLNSCKSKISKEEVSESIGKGESLPAGGEDAIVSKYMGKPSHKSRKERDLLVK